MAEPVISVEHLSKSYLVGHVTAEGGHGDYMALRDVIVHGAQKFVRKAVDVARGRQVIEGDEIEEFWALKDVSFDVRQGEVLGVIGRNGAGKSTLLKVLSRITEPTSGRVVLHGRVASLLEVGTGFHPELTGRENIYLNGAILGMTQREIRKKFDEIVDFAEVERFLDTPVKRYSSGMYVRLAFAVAAHLEPEILVVDEVLAVGDVEFQKKCLGKMQDVTSREGRTILFVSHNHAAIRTLCSHAILLKSGVSSPKMPVGDALALYSSERQENLGSVWHRPRDMAKQRTWFKKIEISLEGAQPKHRLECDCEVVAEKSGRPVIISIDIFDQTLAMIMTAEPKTDPFIGSVPGTYRVHLSVDLPALKPGVYWLGFWMGTYAPETADEVRETVAFEIIDSPISGRTQPYGHHHPPVLPMTRVSVAEVGAGDAEIDATVVGEDRIRSLMGMCRHCPQ